MAILLPTDTNMVLGPDAQACDSRSLIFDKFADPSAKEERRKTWFKRVVNLKPCSEKRHSWIRWLGKDGLGLKPEEILFARLQSRLMVNMAGGVMENAGLCLDRFGMPHIPGSAVKGCARRMAIQNLLEARESKEAKDKLATLLADITLVFGWGEQDWNDKKKDGRFISDLAYALGDQWPEVSKMARQYMTKASHFAGSVSFLPAYPHQLPANDLELDIVTCHHPKYYEGKMSVALDTEEPNPVLFPAVAAGMVLQFAVLPLRCKRDSLSQPANKLHVVAFEWLRQSLETFGLGAKTAAGYGWFDASEEFNGEFTGKLAQQAAIEADKAAKKQRLAALMPDAPWLEKFKTFAEAPRRGVINQFSFDDEKFWPNKGELADERIQFSLLYFLLKIEPEFLAADRANAKSKTAKALAGLKRKFISVAVPN